MKHSSLVAVPLKFVFGNETGDCVQEFGYLTGLVSNVFTTVMIIVKKLVTYIVDGMLL